MIFLLTLYADLCLVVFSLKGVSGLEIFVGGSLVNTPTQDDFLEFCKHDIVLQDRFVDLATLEQRQLAVAKDEPPRLDDGELVRSYASFPLTDPQGRVWGLLHLGAARNHYFNDTVVARLTPLLPFLGAGISQSMERHFLSERKASLLALFAKFLPAPIIRKLLDDQNTVDTTGRKTRVVVLFSDIRSFTSITEQNGAEPVVQFLNRHFQAMVSKISAQGGVVDKFIGDAIVAVFDAEDESSACERAVRAAHAMPLELPTVDVSNLKLAGGRYGIGVGLHVGEVIAGSVGSREKMAFTVIGNVIERAEELEAETKHYDVGMLMSHAVSSGLRDSDLGLVDVTEDSQIPLEEHVYTLDMK